MNALAEKKTMEQDWGYILAAWLWATTVDLLAAWPVKWGVGELPVSGGADGGC